MTRFDRRALFASGAAAALLAATGVSAAPQRGGRLRAALSLEMFERAVAGAMFETLTEVAADGTLRAELATDWQSNADATRWRFALRQGVQFHDGSAFGAASLLSLPYEMRSLDDHTVEVLLDTPDASLPYRLAQPGYEITSATGAGTGLYQMRKMEPGRHFVGERVATHWKAEAGWFDEVDFVHFTAEHVRAQALVEGMVDVADVTSLGIADPRDFQILPGNAVRHNVAMPLTVGKAWPLDNYRMAQRWWMA